MFNQVLQEVDANKTEYGSNYIIYALITLDLLIKTYFTKNNYTGSRNYRNLNQPESDKIQTIKELLCVTVLSMD